MSATAGLFVQPHFDDIALSCGGTVLRCTAAAQPALVVTAFTEGPAADAPLTSFAAMLHEKWGNSDPWPMRKQEDDRAIHILGGQTRRLGFKDAIYREAHYTSKESLTGPIHAGDAGLQGQLASEIERCWRATSEATIYLPLAVGNHVDHQVCHGIGLHLEAVGAEVLYYEDLPYALRENAVEARVREIGSLTPVLVDVSDNLERRMQAITAYASQLPVMTRNYGSLEIEIPRYLARHAGGSGAMERFWRRHTE